MKNAMIVCTVAGFLDFLVNDVELLQNKGFCVHVCTNFEGYEEFHNLTSKLGVIEHQVDFTRSPLTKRNINAFKQVKTLLKATKFELVHCHTPAGGVIARLAVRTINKRRQIRVIYTAHGFHFYKGAQFRMWLIFYPIEKICSCWTDVLITMNSEDYNLAKREMKAKEIIYAPGIGINISKYSGKKENVENKKRELGIPNKSIVLLSIGELNRNKNHETVIRAISGMDVYYLIAGAGEKAEQLKSVAREVGMPNRVVLLGYRSDIDELLNIADIFVLPSFREGLSVSLMEAMAVGLPCAVSKIRGNVDLIDSNGGSLFNPKSIAECKEAICTLLECDQLKIKEYNKQKILNFSSNRVTSLMMKVYSS